MELLLIFTRNTRDKNKITELRPDEILTTFLSKKIYVCCKLPCLSLFLVAGDKGIFCSSSSKYYYQIQNSFYRIF